MELDPSKFKELLDDKKLIEEVTDEDLSQIILYMYHTYCVYSTKEMTKIGHIGMKALFDLCINEKNRRISDKAYEETKEIAKNSHKVAKNSYETAKNSYRISIIVLIVTVVGLLVNYKYAQRDDKGDKIRQVQQQIDMCISNEYLKLQIDDSFQNLDTESKNKIIRDKTKQCIGKTDNLNLKK